MKQAFVTGAAGFIGSHLIDRLLKEGWKVRALSHKRPVLQQSQVEIMSGDVRDPLSLENALKGVDVLFHLASALGATLIGKDEFFDINSRGTENILMLARTQGVSKTIHLSSAGILGKVKKGDIAAENYPPHPQNVYDQSKLEGERIALDFAQKGMNIVVIRPGWVYGPRDRRTFKLIKAIKSGRFFLVTKGRAFQTPVYISDLIAGILLSAEKGKAGEIYHLAGEEMLMVRELVREIAWACGKKIPGFYLPLFPMKIAAEIMDKSFSLFGREAPLTPSKLAFFTDSKPLSIEKAKRDLSFQPEISFHEGIRRALDWYHEQGWLK